MSNEIPEGVVVEKVWLVEARYTPEAAERRPAVRGEHLARAAALRTEGVIVEVGAYADGLSSSIVMLRAESEAAARAIIDADVYVAAGVWGEISVRPFGRVYAAT